MKLDIVVLWITFTIDRLSKMRKLTCHCGQIEIEIDIKDNFEDLYRCNCSMCIRKGAITAIVNKEDLKLFKCKDKIKFYKIRYLKFVCTPSLIICPIFFNFLTNLTTLAHCF